MVQFFKGSADPRDAAYGQLATALGKGMGNGLNTYFMNRSLESVMKDKSLENAPLSKRWEAIGNAVRPYGQKGQAFLQEKIQLDQQEKQEKQEKQDLRKGDVFRRRLSGQPITEEEKKLFTPQEEMAIAKHQQAIELQNLKNQGKSPTQASQPINPDQIKRMQEVRKDPEYEKSTPSKKFRMLTDNGVSKENAEAETKLYAEEEKNKPGTEYSKLREKAVGELVNDSFKKRQEAEELKFNIEITKQALNGEIQEPGLMALAKHDPYGQLFFGLTPDEAILQAVNKKMLAGTKGIFGSKPTESEIFLLLNSMLPSIGKTREANLAGLDVIEKTNDLVILHSDLIDEITEGGTKYVADLDSQLNSRMKPIIDDYKKELIKKNEEVNKTNKDNKSSDIPKGKIRVKDKATGKVGTVTPFDGMDSKYERL